MFFFEKNGYVVIKIIPHDFWDNRYILNWRQSGGCLTKRLKGILWIIFNKLYFISNPLMFHLLNSFEKNQPVQLFTKYLIAVKKV